MARGGIYQVSSPTNCIIPQPYRFWDDTESLVMIPGRYSLLPCDNLELMSNYSQPSFIRASLIWFTRYLHTSGWEQIYLVHLYLN